MELPDDGPQHKARPLGEVPQDPGPAPTSPPVAARPLNVLIDGLNHDLEAGTGISTYARLLSENLEQMGHTTSWLFGRPVKLGRDSLASEVAFYDREQAPSRIGALLASAKRWRHTLLGPELKPDAVTPPRAVIRDPGRLYEPRAWNVPRLYSLAHHRHVWSGKFTQVAAPPGVDVLHLSAPLPIAMRKVKTVVTIHDLIPIRLPYTTLDNKNEIIRRLRTCVANADMVMTVSEASKKDICDYLDVPPEKVTVTYQCADMPPFRPIEQRLLSRIVGRYSLEPQRYALFVGAIEPKKNLRRLIEAFLEVDTGIPLVVAGKKAWLWEKDVGELEQVFGEKAMKRIRFLGYVPRKDLRFLYAGATFLAFPSLYEGFGLPALEAMMSGCPVLTSNVSSLPEICGEAALYVDPFDRDDIREKIERMLGEAELRQWLAKAGMAQARKFSAERYAARLNEAYSRLA